MRTAIVTGASPGSLGEATARALVDAGWRICVTTRAATPAVAGAREHQLDLADGASVRAFADWYSREYGTLDVLVNNAGIHLDLRSRWREPRLTPDGHEIHWRTNYLGTAHLTALLMPLLRESADGRVVNVVSKLHARASNADLFAAHVPYNSWIAYGTSKLALVHHAFELQRRCAPVQGYALHPGSVYTHIADRGLEGHRLLGALRRLLAPVERRMLVAPERAARTSVRCATEPGLAGGRYFRDGEVAEPSAAALDETASARLWDETERWLAALG